MFLFLLADEYEQTPYSGYDCIHTPNIHLLIPKYFYRYIESMFQGLKCKNNCLKYTFQSLKCTDHRMKYTPNRGDGAFNLRFLLFGKQ